MSAEEDTELRDLLIQTLESKGVIGKIKAELRASVFLALEEHEGVGNGLSVKNKKLQDFLNTDKGWTIASLVREFLQFFNLEYTLAVFDPEISSSKKLLPRKQLSEQLNLDEIMTCNIPLLAELTQVVLSPSDDINSKSESSETISIKDKEEFQQNLPLETKTNAVPSKIVEEDNEDGSLKSIDPFYDDFIPDDDKKSGLFSLDKEKDNIAVTSNSKLATTTTTNSFSNSVIKDTKQFNDTFNSKKTFSSLSSLQDLPSLSFTKKPESCVTDEDYEDDFHSSQSGHSGKYSHPEPEGEIKIDSSDHSVEEDIEEDLSAAGDDILNSSISFGEEATTDQTISQASAAGGYDYIESIT